MDRSPPSCRRPPSVLAMRRGRDGSARGQNTRLRQFGNRADCGGPFAAPCSPPSPNGAKVRRLALRSCAEWRARSRCSSRLPPQRYRECRSSRLSHWRRPAASSQRARRCTSSAARQKSKTWPKGRRPRLRSTEADVPGLLGSAAFVFAPVMMHPFHGEARSLGHQHVAPQHGEFFLLRRVETGVQWLRGVGDLLDVGRTV